MNLNDQFPSSAAQQPRGQVYCNGELLQGVHSFTVDNNGFFQADTFRVTLVLSAQPANRGIEWWSAQEKMEMDMLFGFPPDPDRVQKTDLTSFLLGYADDIEIDPLANTITLAGRDHTSKLIDFKRAIVFSTSTLVASDIVTQIALERGLVPVVTKTAVAAGAYYQIVKALVESDSTYWDIVTKLAQIEQFQVYVKGNELHFEPRTPASSDAFVVYWTAPNANTGYVVSNAPKIVFSRNLSIAKDLKVRVMSFDQKTKSVVNEVADRKRVYNKTTSKVAKFDGPAQEYVYSIPNLTAEQAQKRAQSLLIELSKHEMNLRVEMPGDLRPTPQDIIQVQGSPSSFNQTYFPSSIARTYSLQDGFTMSITAKNQTPNNPT